MAQEREYTRLTPRETEILHLTLQGYTVPEIAHQLYIGEETVKSHRKRIIARYGARNMVHVATLFYRGERKDPLNLPEIILVARVKHLLSILMPKLENELNKELVELSKRAMKDLRF